MRGAIQLDFAGRRRRWSVGGAALLVMGAAAAAAVLIDYRLAGTRAAGLERDLAVVSGAAVEAARPHFDAKLSVRAREAAADLATPWTLLLAELERTSQESNDEIAILSVQPDHGKHSVRISAESRTLAMAIAYVQKLQALRSIEFPMLDRHETRADDPTHPIRFELTGSWRDMP
jgi:hypothetical protein